MFSKNNMHRGVILPLAIMIVFFLGILIGVSLLRSQTEIESLTQRVNASRAFYAAEAGLEKALLELKRDVAWRAGIEDPLNPPEYFSELFAGGQLIGAYKISATPLPAPNPAGDTEDIVTGPAVGSWDTTVWVQCWGRGFNPANPSDFVTRRIAALVAVADPLSYFTSTLGNLVIGAGANIGGSILARDVIFANAGVPVNVNGDVLFIQTLDINPQVTVTGNVAQTSPISFASVDVPHYRDLSQTGGRYHAGPGALYIGNLDKTSLGTVNGLVFAEGDIYIQGQVDDDLLIIAGGDIYIEDDLTSPAGHQIGLVAARNVFIPASAPQTLEVNAFVMADGGIFKALGPPGSKNTLNFNGAISVRGDSGGSSGVDLNMYAARNFQYDAALANNRRIPFLNYFTRVVRWVEIPASVPADILYRQPHGAELDNYLNPLF